jgi:hypothetical protein
MVIARIHALLACGALAACTPELVDDSAIVRAPRLLAARSEPAESAPGSVVTTTALWAGPDGPIANPPLDWGFCVVRKAFTDPGSVAPGCLTVDSPDVVAFGRGATATGTLPAFGPDRPDPLPGEAAGRPADPDGTGGYYQPVRVLDDDAAASLVSIRIRCGLPDATPDQAMELLRDYIPNANPEITSVTIDERTLEPLERDAIATFAVTRGETVDLALHWPTCAEAPCGGAEPYLWFDPAARTLTSRHEAMRVSWFATDGAFETSHSGRSESEATLGETTDRWSAPEAVGPVTLWVVLRDDRGGTTWATFHIDVTETIQ